MPPFQEGEDSLFFETFNRNKRASRSTCGAGGPARARGLVRESDAVFSNLRGDQPSELRLTYEDLKGINPRIVCCRSRASG